MATDLYPLAMTPEAAADYDSPKKFRVSNEEWAAFEMATKTQHPQGRSPRSQVLREFMRWYMRRPGASMPKRPDVGAWSTGDQAGEA